MRINAVVVTYNRKELLLECVDAILKQTQSVDNLIIIDNNSTDNTKELLSQEKILDNPKVIYKRLPENIGGAGGFYEGIKLSNTIGCDWVWIMDDDTIPKEECLKELKNAINILKEEKVSFLASSIYGINNEFMNVPNINCDCQKDENPGWYKYLDNGIIKIKEATFVSLLISDKAVCQCGYPVKDYFIWGDDTEYTLRLNKYYGNAYMIGKSIAIHKRKGNTTLSLVNEENKNRINFHYYMIRNNLINLRYYYGIKSMLEFLLKKFLKSFTILFNMKCKYRVKKFCIVNKGILAFLFKKYDHKAFNNRLNTNVIYKK